MIYDGRPQGTLVPLPWEIKVAESRDEAIKQNVWRWNIDSSYIAHIVWDQDEFTYKALCGREYSPSIAPLYFAPNDAKRCKQCQAAMDKATRKDQDDAKEINGDCCAHPPRI